MAGHVAPMAVRDATTPAPTARQFVRFAFFKVDPAWRRLDPELRAEHRRQVAEVVAAMADRRSVILRTYSTVASRGDTDFMVWMVSEEIDDFQEFSARLNQTAMAGWLSQPYHYLSMTKRSIYVDNHEHIGQEGRSNRMVVAPSGRKHLVVYPFVKTRAWYRLSKEERQRQMTEHIAMGHKFPTVKINTTYSFGLDDQEFVVAFETDQLADFLDLVQEMRESEASTHTVRDVPSFTCTLMPIAEALAAVG